MSELKHANSEFTGFGSHSAAEVEQLQKALGLGGQGGLAIPGSQDGLSYAGDSYANQTPGAFRGGNALAVEDLDRTLKLVTFGLEHLRLWKDILKERVPQVVHEYNIQNAYGESDASPFFQMGATPVETDAQYARDVVQIKYLGTKGAVLHNLTLIQAAHGPVVAREVKNKTIELLARNERFMFDASSTLNSEEYDGLKYQIISKAASSIYQSKAFEGYGNSVSAIEAPHILNANGADFDEDLAEDAALTAVNNFGMPMDMYLGTDVHSAFSRAFYAKQRTVPGESLTSGNRVTEHMGTLDYRFKPSLFNRPKLTPTGISAGAGGADPTPTDIAGEFTFGAGGVAPFREALVLAVRATGETAGGILNSGNISQVVITGVANSTLNPVLYFNLYTRAEDGVFGDFRFVKRIAAPANGSNTGTVLFTDEVFNLPGVGSGINAGQVTLGRIPGAADAYLLMHDPDVLCWKQLGSMIKYDLAVTTTQYEWLQLLYGTPLVMAPLKNVIVRNLKSEA